MEKSKKRRGFESSDEEAVSDRLRDLPEPILQHILSLLPYRSAVVTSILSTQWRRQWEQRWPHPSSLHFVKADRNPKAFVAGVNRQIEFQPPSHRLDALTVSFLPLISHLPHIRRWLNYAHTCGVADLRLDLHPSAPRFIFRYDSPSLVRLTLTGVHITRVGRYRNLVSLEVLSLHQVTISNEAMKNLIASCPALRMLELHCCRDIPLPDSLSTDSTLRVFVCQTISELVLTASKLRCLYLRYVSLHCIAFRFSVLEDVYMTCGDESTMERHWGKFPWNPTKAFALVRFLTVGGVPFQHLARSSSLELDKLQELQILMEEMNVYQLHIIYEFFKNVLCPSLERLFIELPPLSNMEMLWKLQEEEPLRLKGFTFQHLRIIKLKNFRGVSNEMHLVEFLLKRATRLESMIIVAADVSTRVSTYHDPGAKYVLRQKLELLPKASANATLLFRKLDDDQVQPSHHEVQNASCRCNSSC